MGAGRAVAAPHPKPWLPCVVPADHQQQHERQETDECGKRDEVERNIIGEPPEHGEMTEADYDCDEEDTRGSHYGVGWATGGTRTSGGHTLQRAISRGKTIMAEKTFCRAGWSEIFRQ